MAYFVVIDNSGHEYTTYYLFIAKPKRVMVMFNKKIIIGAILTAFSGPCIYHPHGFSPDPFVETVSLFLGILLFIFGAVALAKGIKEYFNA
jgi:hypothetical protein